MSSKAQLKEQIVQGNLKSVLQVLLSSSEGELHNQVVHLSSRLSDLTNKTNKGILSEEQTNLERNRIANALLALVEELPDNLVLKDIEEFKEHLTPNRTSINWKKWLGIAVGLIAALAGIAELSGYSLRDVFGGNSAFGEALTLTIKVRNIEGNRPLKGEGLLVIDYGNGTQTLKIDDEGKVDLREIPIHLKGNQISILLEDAKNYEVVANETPYLLDGKPITFQIRLHQQLGIIKGKVRSRDGKKMLREVLIEVAGETTYSDSLGNFYMELPPEKWKAEYLLFARKGDQVKEEKYYPNLNNFEIRLQD